MEENRRGFGAKVSHFVIPKDQLLSSSVENKIIRESIEISFDLLPERYRLHGAEMCEVAVSITLCPQIT
jgi:hypothetical protein